MPASNVRIYAHWTPLWRNVTWHAGFGWFNNTTSRLRQGSPLGDFPTLERTGYTLDGWFTEANGRGVEVNPRTLVPDRNTTFYAHWLPNNNQLTFDARGGTNPASRPVQEGRRLNNLPAPGNNPDRINYSFAGWFERPNGLGRPARDMNMPAHGLRVYAHWVPTMRTITWEANFGGFLWFNNNNPSSWRVQQGSECLC